MQYICLMDKLKRLFNFYVFGNVHVGLAGFCLVMITGLNKGAYDVYSSLFVGLSIIVSYNFIRYLEIDKERLSWYKIWLKSNLKALFFVTIICSVLLIMLLFKIRIEFSSWIIITLCSFITFFYAIPLLKNRDIEISFRNFPSVKIFSIAFCWAAITVFFPLLEANMLIGFDAYLEFIQRFLFLIVITLPFDIRDLVSDDLRLKTIPQLIGVYKTKLVGIALLICCFTIDFFKEDFSLKNTIVFSAILVITGVFLLNSSEKRSRCYTAFWVEGIPIYWFILLFLSSIIC